MITINYIGYVQGPTAKHLVRITATGTTPEEVVVEANRQASAIGASELTASGLNNREADWIAAFGSDYSPECRFIDSPQIEQAPQAKIKNFFFAIFFAIRPKLLIVAAVAVVLLWVCRG